MRDEEHARVAIEARQVSLERRHLGVPVLGAANEVAERLENLGRAADGQQRRLLAAAPRARQHAIERNGVLAERLAGATGVGAALLAQVALRGAVLELEAGRIAVAAVPRCIRMTHEGDMPGLS